MATKVTGVYTAGLINYALLISLKIIRFTTTHYMLLEIWTKRHCTDLRNKHRVISTTQERGRMDAEGLKSLACSTWWTGETKRLHVYAFETHVTESMKAAFAEKTPI